MKRSLIVLVTLIVCLLNHKTADSQRLSEADPTANFGVKGGVNLFAIEGSTIDQTDRRTGYQIGLFVSSEILESWLTDLHLRFEINYVETTNRNLSNRINRIIYDGVELFVDEELHGFEFERDIGGPFTEDELFNENVYSTVIFHVIEAPIRFSYAIPTGLIAPYVLIGPTFSVIADFDHSFTLSTGQGETYTQTDITDVVDQHYSKINFSADVGVGLRLPYGFFVEGYYSHGFTDSMKFYENKTSRRGFMASMGIQF